MSDEYEETDFEEEDFQEAPEVNTLSRYEEIVFCPDCDVYMPYNVEGALVRRRCPQCGKQFEGGQEVFSGREEKQEPPSTSAPKRAAQKPGVPKAEDAQATCAAVTKAGTPCQNLPRTGSKYCSSHRGYRPPRSRA